MKEEVKGQCTQDNKKKEKKRKDKKRKEKRKEARKGNTVGRINKNREIRRERISEVAERGDRNRNMNTKQQTKGRTVYIFIFT